jgi:hypothetical protein
MTRVVLDESWRQKLPGFGQPLELCDERGAVLGYFVPPNDRDRAWFEWAKKQFTREEIERAGQQTGGRPLSEILGRLAAQ